MAGWTYLLAPAAGIVCWLAVGRVLAWLHHRVILDEPNERSSHAVAVPRGGGIGVMAGLLPALAVLWISAGPGAWSTYGVLAAALLLALISWRDDRHTLGAAPRLVAHVAAAAVAALALPDGALVLQGLLPLWADRLVAGLVLVYFLNIFNFMDGIDGITGVETLAIGLGAALLAWLGTTAVAPAEGLILAAVALAWLVWNWHPARLFLGDVGSVPLGFLIGWLLLRLAADGAWIASLALPAYYLADATLTLARRTLRGDKPWEAHREHAYQRATQRGLGHHRVSLWIAACNAGLIALALAAETVHWAIGLFAAPMLAFACVIFLRGGIARRPSL